MIHFGDPDPDDEEAPRRPDEGPDAEIIDADSLPHGAGGVGGDSLQEELFEFSEATEQDQVDRIADRVFEQLVQRFEQQRAGTGPLAAPVPTAEQIAATTGTLIVLGAHSATGVTVQAVNAETGAVRRAVISEQVVAGEQQPAAVLPQVRAGEYDVMSHRHFVTVDVIPGEVTIVDLRG